MADLRAKPYHPDDADIRIPLQTPANADQGGSAACANPACVGDPIKPGAADPQGVFKMGGRPRQSAAASRIQISKTAGKKDVFPSSFFVQSPDSPTT
jgi:hypothetical protein